VRRPPARPGAFGAALLLGALLGLAGGCAGAPTPEEQARAEEVPRPEWRVGDRWLFQRTERSGAVSVVAHQVVAATPEGYAVQVQGAAPELTRYWTPEFHLARQVARGQPAARFQPAAMYFDWPLRLGKTWTQEFDYEDGTQAGRYGAVWQVGPLIEPVDVVAGKYYTVRIEYRSAQGQRLATYWYSPRVRYWVRFRSEVNGYLEDLLEFRPWQTT
jgi:hypothetical protein